MTYDRIRFVLVEPSHPGNIGGAARAMKNMGFRNLVLVAPERFPDAEATARASGADDILAATRVVSSLEEALTGCGLVCGTTARDRTIGWPTLAPRDFAEQSIAGLEKGDIAIVFGRERSGLSNDELDRCHKRVAIPANSEYPSLNLACAVQVIAYELRCAILGQSPEAGDAPVRQESDQPVGAEHMERFYEHLEQVLIEIEFLNPKYPKKLMRRLKRLFNRAAPIENEMNILRGILTAVQDRLRRYTKT